MGRPRREIDWSEVDKLLLIQCTDEEVAGWFSTDVKLIKRACKRDKGVTFAQYSAEKRDLGKISLRRALWQKALDPKNTAATIFACKTMLGLNEYPDKMKVEAKIDGKAEIVLTWQDEAET